MDVFNFIKQRSGGRRAASSSMASGHTNMRATATIATSALRPSTDTEDDDGDTDDEGPFFDMEFSVPDEDANGEEYGDGRERPSVDWSAGEAEHGLFNSAAAAAAPERSCSAGGGGRVLRSDPIRSLSPSETRSTRAKSTTKLRVLMLGFRKPKSTAAELNRAADPAAAAASPKQQQQQRQSNLFVKLKVEEVPIVSLFTRDNSSRSSGSSGRASKMHADDDTTPPAAGSEKRFSKDALQRYLSKIKPLYVKVVSKQYGEKQRFSGAADEGGREPPAAVASSVKCQKPHGGGNLPAGLRVVCRRLGKSRSASSAVAAVRSPPALALPRRRDDSLLEQQDGIQSAIAHCKRSFNVIRESESPLVRSRSDPGEDRSLS